MDDPSILFGWLFGIGLYFLPVIVAFARKSRRAGLITVLNIFLGWTVIGWLVLLIVSFMSASRIAPPVAPVPATGTMTPPALGGAAEQPPAPRSSSPPSLADLDFTNKFLLESYEKKIVDRIALEGLLKQLDLLEASARETTLSPSISIASTAAPPAVQPAATAQPEAAPVLRLPSPPPQVRIQPAARPPSRPTILDRAWEMVRSDFAVHGLAYLGVAFTFTGTLGFVLFAFNTVNIGLRAAAGIIIPTILFLTAWFLYRRASVLVAHSLETLAAAITPVALFADLSLFIHGWVLTTAQIGVALTLLALYWFFWQRRRASPLRFLIAGMFWVAAWAGGFYFQSGYSAIQVAITAAAILVTVALSRLAATHPLASPTRVAAAVGTAAVFVLVILFAITQAPPLALLLAGLAILIIVELLALDTARPLAVSIIQPLLLATFLVAGARLLPSATQGPLVVLSFLALLEWQERRRSTTIGLALTALGVLTGLSFSLVDPWASVVGWSAAGLWIHLRRLRPTPALAALPSMLARPVVEILAGALPIGLAAGLLRALPAGRAVVTLAVIVLLIAIPVRLWLRRDPFYAWWIPAAAAALVVTTIDTPGGTVEGVAAACILGVALVVAPRWPALRTWMAAATLIWASGATFGLAGVPIGTQIVAFGIAGLLLVAFAEIRRSSVSGHLALVGFLLGFGAITTDQPDWVHIITLTSWVASLGVAIVSHETRGSAVVDLLSRLGRRVRLDSIGPALPPITFTISVPFLVVALGQQLGLLAGRRSLAGVTLAITALAYAVGARLLQRRRPLAPTAATAGVLLSGVGIAVAAPELWPVIASVTLAIAIVLVIGGDLRRNFMTWFAWLMSLVLLVLLAHAVGVPTESLHLVLLGAGAVLVIGALLHDDIAAGRRAAGEGLRLGWLLPPTALGALAIPAGLAFTFTGGAASFGWWLIVAAAFYLVVAVQLRAGLVSAASYALAAFGVSVLVPWHPLDRPWLFVPLASLLVVISAAIARWAPKPRDLFQRWDLPPFLIAHLVGGLALARTVAVGSVPPTWSALGALSLAIAAWRRHWAWAAGGVALLLVGAQAAGPGWLALALGISAVVTIVIAQRTAGPLRTAMQWATAAAAGSAWLSVLVWRELSVDWSVATTALAFGALWLIVAAFGRRWLSAGWLLPAGTLATIAIAAAATAGMTVGQQRHPYGLMVAGGLALHATGSALAARSLRLPWLRELAATTTALAVGVALFDFQPSPSVAGGVMAMLGALAIGLALLVSRRTQSAWLRPLLLLSGLEIFGAIAYANAALPARGLMIATLLLAAVEAAALGRILRRGEPMYLVPVLACAAWVTYAADALQGNPNWITVPIGVAALALVELIRHDRRAAKLPVMSGEFLTLEYAGMAFVVGASMVQTITVNVAFGLLAIVLGAALATWGYLTRVRRRTEVGAGAILMALVLMLSVPVVRIVPQFQGALLWGALAALGVVLLIVATSLEQGRSTVVKTIRRVEELMIGWE